MVISLDILAIILLIWMSVAFVDFIGIEIINKVEDDKKLKRYFILCCTPVVQEVILAMILWNILKNIGLWCWDLIKTLK